MERQTQWRNAYYVDKRMVPAEYNDTRRRPVCSRRELPVSTTDDVDKRMVPAEYNDTRRRLGC
jgi:hypothetical protein